MALPANPTSPSSPFQSPADWITDHSQSSHRSPPHGQKRPIDEQDESTIPPYHGLKRLRISPKRINYTQRPVRASSSQTYRQPTVTAEQYQELLDVPIPPEQQHIAHPAAPIQYPCRLAPEALTCDTPPPQHLPSNNEDFMPLDDNPHRIFISDLDAAIAEIEAEERAQAEKQQEAAFFLPDEVVKEISGVPQHVLQTRPGVHSQPLDPSTSQALILYKDPESISVSEEYDAVRKAVYEARKRIRERNESTSTDESIVNDSATQMVPVEHAPVDPVDFGYPLGRQNSTWRPGTASMVAEDHDSDAMEIE